MNEIWSPEEEARRLKARFVGVKQSEFARKFNVPGGPSMLNQQISGTRPINMEAALAYAKGFRVSLHEISPRLALLAHELLDHLEQPDATNTARFISQSGNISHAPKTTGAIPLISWSDVGEYRDVNSAMEPSKVKDWVAAFESTPGPRAFALTVNGDSMTSPFPGERSFPDGCVIIVDPSQAVRPGDYVVARDSTTQQATFKRLMADGGRWFLKPTNPAYPTVEISHPAEHVIGKVTEYQIRGAL